MTEPERTIQIQFPTYPQDIVDKWGYLWITHNILCH